ncbi:hypothetical protein [Blattabacterium cuenoti]|uniref:hypothetical protein n=1 Tax=Blattabacterium cuenoti TaxID=1653831 RepID=UPI001A92D1D9|nr:hypothetical protein [Blattabacterium cuenoti]
MMKEAMNDGNDIIMKYEEERIIHELLYRSYSLAFLYLCFSLVLISHLLYHQFFVKNKKIIRIVHRTIRLIKNHREQAKENFFCEGHAMLFIYGKKYNIFVDFQSISNVVFSDNVKELSRSLSCLFHQPKSIIYKRLWKEKKKGNRYFFLAKGLDYRYFKTLQTLPVFQNKLIKKGLIIQKKTYEIPCLKNSGLHKDFPIQDERILIKFSTLFHRYMNGEYGKKIEKWIIYNILWKGLQWKNFIINSINKTYPSYPNTIHLSIEDGKYDHNDHLLFRELFIEKTYHGEHIIIHHEKNYHKNVPTIIHISKKDIFFQKNKKKNIFPLYHIESNKLDHLGHVFNKQDVIYFNE